MQPSRSELERQSAEDLRLLLESEREDAKRGLLAFTQWTKPDYEVNWHHAELCRVLDRFARGEIRFLMVFMPPRHGKSELVSRRLPAMLHGLYPNAEIMAASYGAQLASDMCKDVQRIMDTPEYRALYPDARITPEGKRSKYARNDEEHELLPIQSKAGGMIRLRGKYRGQGVGGAFNGRGANFIIIDDPIKGRVQADSEAFREHLWKWYNADLRSRLEKNGQVLITHTRWHEDDLAGRILADMKEKPNSDQFEIFILPAVKEEEGPKLPRKPLEANDPRVPGQALWPTKYDEQELASTKSRGTRDWLSVYQQRPSAEEGNIFKRIWWKFYRKAPERFHEIIQSWDFAVTDSAGADYTVGQVWGRLGSQKYLLDEVRAIKDFPGQVRMVRELCKRWPQARKKLVEKKANGPAVVATLKVEIGGFVEVEPKGDKVARANACTPDIEAGDVWLPDTSICVWIDDYLDELSSFPNAKKDDRVDATSQALNHMYSKRGSYAPHTGHGAI